MTVTISEESKRVREAFYEMIHKLEGAEGENLARAVHAYCDRFGVDGVVRFFRGFLAGVRAAGDQP